ncbi:uncharacterized protein [Zea mays]|jgi:hypothetical protein|uniref:Uncharacterized protein n=1 Tax=Zea mays TaxID=4577 RepID=C0P426_MAIZE|nr:uncharacterized protein LOC100382066 [Zea mays]ACN27742.1 unknown [Zea mays]|eukprot:XP_020404000.1 uncharacterized protein LOC100382066 [Zea mays]
MLPTPRTFLKRLALLVLDDRLVGLKKQIRFSPLAFASEPPVLNGDQTCPWPRARLGRGAAARRPEHPSSSPRALSSEPSCPLCRASIALPHWPLKHFFRVELGSISSSRSNSESPTLQQSSTARTRITEYIVEEELQVVLQRPAKPATEACHNGARATIVRGLTPTASFRSFFVVFFGMLASKFLFCLLLFWFCGVWVDFKDGEVPFAKIQNVLPIKMSA